MALQVAADLRKKEADATGNDLNNALIRIYDGTAPADVDSALGANTLLAELTFGADAFPVATDDGTDASITANTITGDSSADATGNASFFRVVDSAGTTTKMQGSCTIDGGGGDMTMGASVSITSGVAVNCTSFVYKRPQS